MKAPIYHLLRPGEFCTWCRPDKPVGNFNVTVLPSKTTCVNCLTIFRAETRGRRGYFRVKHTDRFNP